VGSFARSVEARDGTELSVRCRTYGGVTFSCDVSTAEGSGARGASRLSRKLQSMDPIFWDSETSSGGIPSAEAIEGVISEGGAGNTEAETGAGVKTAMEVGV
jgi:hypothetical protein